MENIAEETRTLATPLNFKRFHLGCGTVFLKDWLNIGYWSHLEHGQLYSNPNQTENTILLNYDLRYGIPAEDESLNAVYHSHLLEHLTFKEGLAFLGKVYNALKPGGIHRIIVPDLRAFAQAYLEDNDLLLKKYQEHVLAGEAEIYQTKASIFMGMLHNHGHQMGYDWETLSWALKITGFKKIRQTLFQESDMSDIKEIEEYSPLRALESLCVECYK